MNLIKKLSQTIKRILQMFNKIILMTLLSIPLLAQSAQNYPLVRSDRDGQRNLICTYANGESINMGQSWSPCPSAIQR